MIVAGIGCRHGATQQDILDVLELAAAQRAVAVADIAVLATISEKVREPGLTAAASALDKPLRGLPLEALAAAAPHVATSSPRVMSAMGVPSIAEAAALAAAGRDARLLGPRAATRVATCALATNEGPQKGVS